MHSKKGSGAEAKNDKNKSGKANPAKVKVGQGVVRARMAVQGLDDILGGGLPVNHLYLIDGDPGTGKTTIAMQFLLEGVRNGERGLYVTLSESKEELTGVANSHGWDLEGVEIFELSKQGLADIEEGYTIFHPAEVELQQTIDAVLKQVDELNPSRRFRFPLRDEAPCPRPVAFPAADPRAQAVLLRPQVHDSHA
ncbi:MAG TPA: ATPase domain-containing protein [Gemmatimonadaceae bacterium]|nr:ATPase domain-containing protein [Gemmatimonadaceae bacterium]